MPSGEADRVLGEPPLHFRFLPDPFPERVGGGVGMGSEEFGPVSWPLLVEVAKPSLPGDRSREDDNVGQRGQGQDNSLGKRRLEEVGYLEAKSEVETTPDLEWPAQISDLKIVAVSRGGSGRPRGRRYREHRPRPVPNNTPSHAPSPQPTSTTLVGATSSITSGTMSLPTRATLRASLGNRRCRTMLAKDRRISDEHVGDWCLCALDMYCSGIQTEARDDRMSLRPRRRNIEG